MFLSTEKINEFECKQGAVRAVRFNVDGNYCITCGSDKTLKLWNPYKGVVLKTYSGHGYEVLDAQSSCDSSQIVSGGMDKYVYLWDVSSAQILKKYRGHIGQVNVVRFNEESSIILSGSIDGTIKTWDCRSRTKDPIQVMDESKDGITSIQVSNYEILSGSLDGHVRRYDLRNGEMFSDNLGASVSCVNFTRDGQCILVSCLDNTLKLLDKETGQLLAEYLGHQNKEYRLESCLNNTDTHVISGSEEGKVYVWELIESKLCHVLEHPGRKIIHSLAQHPSKPFLLTASENRIYLWSSPDQEIKVDDDVED